MMNNGLDVKVLAMLLPAIFVFLKMVCLRTYRTFSGLGRKMLRA